MAHFIFILYLYIAMIMNNYNIHNTICMIQKLIVPLNQNLSRQTPCIYLKHHIS